MVRPLRHLAVILAATFAMAQCVPARASHDTVAQDTGGHGGHDHAAMMKKRQGPPLAASATYDAKGRLWAVYAVDEGVRLRHSDDDGATWSEPVAVNHAPEAVGADGDARPRVAVGPQGEVYVTWTRPLARAYSGNIRFARSLDGGRTFAEPVTVHADRQEITHRFDSMAITPDGRIFIAWVDKRDLPQGDAAKSWRGAAIYYAVSSDRGETFRGDWRVAAHSCECCRIALLPQPDGSVVAFWRHVFEPNVRDHAVAVLHDGGEVGEVRRATFDDWAIDACPHHGGSLAQDAKGRLHAVWFTGTPGKEGVYYGRIGAGHVEGQQRIGGDTAAHADLAIAGERVAIVWKEFDGEKSVLRAMRSDDGGATWRESEIAATAQANDQPKVMVGKGGFEVLWNTREQPLRMVALP
jgi:hypothetical protein